MNDFTGEVIANSEIAPGAFLLEMSFSGLPEMRGGQFAMLETPREDCVLRRPLGICMAAPDYAAFLMQVKGGGTEAISRLECGDTLRVTMPLGNGFPVKPGATAAIVGGGFGIAPLYMTAAECGGNVRIYNGFATAKQVMLADRFAAVGRLTVCTDDGSRGYRGYPVNALAEDMDGGFAPDVIYCCGPEPLMRAVKKLGEERGVETHLSLEQRMGCGVGACLTCTCKLAGHNTRVCKDGPVFRSTEVYL